MQILMDVTINWMAQLNPDYTTNIINVLKDMPDRIKTGVIKTNNNSTKELQYTYINMEGIDINWELFNVG
jgi:hypothetical protein